MLVGMAELDEGVREIDICICSLIVILWRKPVIFEVCVCVVCIQIERVKKKWTDRFIKKST
jgi:hypothetical protein